MNFIDIHAAQLNKSGEELCGDRVLIDRGHEYSRVVLSDGLGSGVKANILATLTGEIAMSMLQEGADLNDVVETIMGTLPICQERGIAYATLTIFEINNTTNDFRILNYENPEPIFIENGAALELDSTEQICCGRKFKLYVGTLKHNDFIGLISDGVCYAGMGNTYNFGWGMRNITDFLCAHINQRVTHIETVVEALSSQTNRLYQSKPGDDASCIGIYNRRRRRAMIFTGPPENKEDDSVVCERLLQFEGRRIVCGGTSSNIVAREIGQQVFTKLDSLREEVPPLGTLPGVDLVTEGILTLNKTLEVIKEVDGDYSLLPNDRNAAMLLALELLVADEITFLVGQKINSYYQNPKLPMNFSIRNSLVSQLVALLETYDKEIQVEYF